MKLTKNTEIELSNAPYIPSHSSGVDKRPYVGRNEAVVEAFMCGESAKTKNLETDGENLWSYWANIAYWEGDTLIINTNNFSVTTSKHQGYLRHYNRARNGIFLGFKQGSGYGARENGYVRLERVWNWFGKETGKEMFQRSLEWAVNKGWSNGTYHEILNKL
jgi:hypothetical protein